MTQQYDHRAADVVISKTAQIRSAQQDSLCPEDHENPERFSHPRFWMAETLAFRAVPKWYEKPYLLAYTLVTSPTNHRTMLACLMPKRPAGHSLRLIYPRVATGNQSSSLLATLNSFVCDYICRNKIGGVNLNPVIVYQLPIPHPRHFADTCPWGQQSLESWISARVLELTYTAWDIEPFARDCGWFGPPFRWDEERRFVIRCELDAAIFHLYLPAEKSSDWHLTEGETAEDLQRLKAGFQTPRDAVAYIMDTFPIVRRKDEERYGGKYRTKRVILEMYDAMQESIRTGHSYQTRLDPPPGPPVDASGKFMDYAEIAANPPPHFHLPRDHAGSRGELHLSDLSHEFPGIPFVVRLGTESTAGRMRVTPVPTSGLNTGDQVILATPSLRLHGAAIAAAIGKLGIESRTDAATDERYILISVRGDDGVAQARFAEAEWKSLLSIGRVETIA